MDLTVPGGVGGVEATQAILDFDPNAVIVVASGYSDNPVLANYRDFGFKGMINRVMEAFPDVSVYATTLRQVISSNHHMWGGIISENGNWHVVEPRDIYVYDRIGGGDGFVGGLLYGIAQGWDAEKWPQFGWATGALATTFLTDYAQPADEDMVWSIWEGNARVKR